MQQIQLYIEGQRVELFEDETISLTQTIQNVKDIDKIFTDFSKQFNIPASRDNNKIFKHYYNYDITNGYDARYKASALIKINGVDFKKGSVRLNGVKLKDNKPNTYKIVFFGETITLNELLGEDEIANLPLTQYNHNYNESTVYSGLTVGLSENGVESSSRDIVYPLFSHTNRYIYDTTAEGTSLDKTTNLYTTGGGTAGVNYTDLKPAIKLKNLITAIEDKYPLVFSDDFFAQSQFQELYMLMHRESGGAYAGLEEQNKVLGLNDWNYSVGDDNLTNPIVATRTSGQEQTYWNFALSITTPDDGVYNVTFKDRTTGTTIKEVNGLTGNTQTLLEVRANALVPQYSYDLDIIISSPSGSNFTTFTPILDSTFTRIGVGGTVTNGTYNISGGVSSIISFIDSQQQMPKMKVIDFLTSIFKLFNLTAYVKNNVIVVETLDTYYSKGKYIDITNRIIKDNSEVDRAMLYRYIGFKYDKPKTFQIIKKNERDNDGFGDLDYTGSDNFDGGRYTIDVKFEHLLYECLYDANVSSKEKTPLQYGWLVDKKQDPTSTSPIIFYNANTPIDDTSFGFGFIGVNGKIDTYNRPSNVKLDGTQTINFGAEINEFTEATNTFSLFDSYYKGYISNLFDVKTRLYKVSAYIPLKFLIKYELNDVIVISNKQYSINSITTNFQTGKTDFELINKFKVSAVPPDVLNYDLNFTI